MVHGKCCCNSCRRVTLWHPNIILPNPEDPTDDWVLKAIARVTWGDGCDGPEVEVDWKQGVILDLSGCWDSVVLEVIENTGADEDVFFTYGALSACCGAGAARGCATRTTASVSAATGVSVMIPVPPFAYAVTFAPHLESTDAFFVADTGIFQLGSGNLSVITHVNGDEFPTEGWTLVGGVESIGVLNAAVEDVVFEAVFLIGV